jgi:hypothetical protein
VQPRPAGEAISRTVLRSLFQQARLRADEMAAATEQLLELEVPARVAAAAPDWLVQLRDG